MKCVLCVIGIYINNDNLGDLPGDEASREKMSLKGQGYIYLWVGRVDLKNHDYTWADSWQN